MLSVINVSLRLPKLKRKHRGAFSGTKQQGRKLGVAQSKTIVSLKNGRTGLNWHLGNKLADFKGRSLGALCSMQKATKLGFKTVHRTGHYSPISDFYRSFNTVKRESTVLVRNREPLLGWDN